MDNVAIVAISIGLSSLVTSAVWSMTAFNKYVTINARLAVLETKIDLIVTRHESSCVNFRRYLPESS